MPTKVKPTRAASGPSESDAPRLVDTLLDAWPKDWHFKFASHPQAKAILATTGGARTAAALALLPAITRAYETQHKEEAAQEKLPAAKRSMAACYDARMRMARLHEMLTLLLGDGPSLTAAQADQLFGWLAKRPEGHLAFLPQAELVAIAGHVQSTIGLTPKVRAALKTMRGYHDGIPSGASKRLIAAVDELLAAKPAAPEPKALRAPKPRKAAAATGADDAGAAAEAQRRVLAMAKSWPADYDYGFKPTQQPEGKALLGASLDVRMEAVRILLGWMSTPRGKAVKVEGLPQGGAKRQYTRIHAREMLSALLRAKLPFTPAEAEAMFKMVAGYSDVSTWSQPIAGLVALAERMHESGELSDAAKGHLTKIRAKLEKDYVNSETRKFVARINAILESGSLSLSIIAPGEAWSDQALADFAAMSAKGKPAWHALLRHASTASSAKPSDKWDATAAKLVDAVGKDAFAERLIEWLALLPKPRTQRWPHRWANTSQTDMLVNDGNADVLRGLAWMAPLTPSTDVCRALGKLCETSLKKLPGIGPRLPKLANAAVHSLGKIAGEDALGQLARLKTRVTFRTTLQQIDKALEAAAARLGVTKADLEELGVPAYGFDDAGVRRETFGDGAACELRIEGRKVVTTWTNEKGKVVKSPPAGVKEKYADELKELKLAAADAEKMLTAQRDRIDALLGTPKTWKLGDVRERYLQHPIVGRIVRKLIWIADGVPVLFANGADPTDVKGKPVKLGKTAEVALWHPAGRPVDEIVAWRKRLEDLQITQPFKQAHREVYLLTDAERRTRTYSNRFAAHVIRQHQFNALAAQRGWRNKLRLMVDDEYPPATKDLPAFGLRAEFWVEGIGDNYGTDTTDSGSYLRLSTDQVRFYRTGAAQNFAHAGGGGYSTNAHGRGTNDVNEPVPIEDVPVLALSETLRDVDLFVGVASVGNDPTWQDGGPEGRYRDYWQAYSFGDLSATAVTRRQVLESLLPRLTKLRDRAKLTDKFLVVRGELRAYKIHLGSGNILMEPHDQYLCIVPARGAAAQGAPLGGSGGSGLFLPFDGDATLSVILSKAFLLADDTNIKDASIVSQIKRA